MQNATAIFAGGTILVQAISTVPLPIERRLPDLKLTDLRLQFQSWWLVTGIYALALEVNATLSFILLNFIAFHILKTFFSTAPLRFADRHAMFLAYGLIPAQLAIAYNGYSMWINYALLFIPFVWLAFFARGKRWLNSAARITWGLFGSSGALSYMTWFAPSNHIVDPILAGLILFVYVAIFMTLSQALYRFPAKRRLRFLIE